MQARTLIGVYHFVWGAWCVDLGRGGLGGTGVSSSGIITTAFFAFSSLAPSSVDPLSPQRTLKMKETPLSDRRPQRSKHVGGGGGQCNKMNGYIDFQFLFFWVLLGSKPLIIICLCVCVGVYVCMFMCVWVHMCVEARDQLFLWGPPSCVLRQGHSWGQGASSLE